MSLRPIPCYDLVCPACGDGEKVMEPNRWGGRWEPHTDGWFINEAASCVCPLNDEQVEDLQRQCLDRYADWP